MGIEGRLIIRLQVRREAVKAVGIESSRPVHACRVFHGKPVAESQRLLPALFSICGTAQACAGVRACEQALGLRASTRIERQRDALVNMETLREHLWRILLNWPSFTGGEVDEAGMSEMVGIQRDYRRMLCPNADPFGLGGTDNGTNPAALEGVLSRLAALLRRTVFGMAPGDWLGLRGREVLMAWAEARQTIAAALIDQVRQAGWSAAGACECRALPDLPEDDLHRAMEDAAFVEQPRWSGHCRETSSLTRVETPLLDELKREYGNGLLVRLVARLTEIAGLAGRLRPDTANTPGEEADTADAANPGLGQAAAARGQLVHRVRVDGDRVESYQILAPTEWNFHPEGVVARSLSALRGDAASVERQARLLIDAIDPCVGYELTVVNGSTAYA